MIICTATLIAERASLYSWYFWVQLIAILLFKIASAKYQYKIVCFSKSYSHGRVLNGVNSETCYVLNWWFQLPNILFDITEKGTNHAGHEWFYGGRHFHIHDCSNVCRDINCLLHLQCCSGKILYIMLWSRTQSKWRWLTYHFSMNCFNRNRKYSRETFCCKSFWMITCHLWKISIGHRGTHGRGVCRALLDWIFECPVNKGCPTGDIFWSWKMEDNLPLTF